MVEQDVAVKGELVAPSREGPVRPPRRQYLARIALDRIEPAAEGQARQDFDDERLRALAESVRRSGIREPIIVTPHGAEEGKFQIVAGERRWRAARLAGLAEIPCMVDPGLDARGEKLLAQAEENFHRENLNAMEEATVLVQLMEERRIHVREAGALLGKTPRQARRLLQIHGAAAPIQRALRTGKLEPRAAIELVRIHNTLRTLDPTSEKRNALRRIDALVERVVREGWSFRRLEAHAARVAREGSVREEGGEADADAGPRSEPAEVAPPARLGRRPSAVKWRGQRVTIDVALVKAGALDSGNRETLIETLESLLWDVRRA